MSQIYAFVDGNYIRARFEHVMKTLYGEAPLLEYGRMTTASRVFYYDAVEDQREDESPENYQQRVAPRFELHRYINRITNWHVREGYVRRGPKRQQKGVDVMLSVDAMENAVRGNMAEAILYAGDLDFEPLVKGLVRLGVRVIVCYSALSVAQELLDAADESRPITVQDFFSWTPSQFQSSRHGFSIQSPTSFNPQNPNTQRTFDKMTMGRWRDRDVALYSSTHDAHTQPRLYLAPSALPGAEPTLVAGGIDVGSLVQAFQLTYGGEISWDGPGVG